MFEGWTSPFAQANRQAEDRNAAWNAMKNDPGAAALIAGLSMLSNNDGSRSFGNLVGRAGFDTLAGLGSMEAQRRAQERQADLDAERKQYRDMQMQGMQDAQGEIVPGVSSSSGQISEDAGLAVAEEGRANRGPSGAPFGERYRNQREARQTKLEDRAFGLDAGQAERGGEFAENFGRLRPYGDIDGPEADNGAALRSVFGARYGAVGERTRQAYNALAPEGTTDFSSVPLRDSFKEALPGGQFASRRPEISRFMERTDDAVANGRTAAYRDLQGIRTQLTDLAMKAHNSGDAALNRVASAMKSRLDQHLMNVGETALESAQPRPGAQAYRAAPPRGFTPEQAGALEEAKAERAARSGTGRRVW